MTPESAREQYRRYQRAWARHGVRCSLRREWAHLYHQGPYGSPDGAASVRMVRHAAAVNLDAMRLAADTLMERPNKASATPMSPGRPSDPQAEQRWPQLWEYLTTTVYGDGSPREPSSLLVFLQDGMVKGMLRDKDGDRCLWIAHKGLLGLLDTLDTQLGEPEPDWRPDRKAKGEPAPRGRRAS